MLAQAVLETLSVFMENIHKYRDKNILIQLDDKKVTLQNYFFIVLDAYILYKCGRNEIVSIYNYSTNDLSLSSSLKIHITREVFEDYVVKLHRLIHNLSVDYNNVIVAGYEDRMVDFRTAVLIIMAADYAAGSLNEEYDIELNRDGTVNYVLTVPEEDKEEAVFYNPYEIEDELAEIRESYQLDDLSTPNVVPFMDNSSPDEVEGLKEKVAGLQSVIEQLTINLPNVVAPIDLSSGEGAAIWKLVLTVLIDLTTLTTPQDIDEVYEAVESTLKVKLSEIYTGLTSSDKSVQSGLITVLNDIYEHYKEDNLLKFYSRQSEKEHKLYELKTLEFLLSHLLLVVSPDLYYNYLVVKMDMLQLSMSKDVPIPGTDYRSVAQREIGEFISHALSQGNASTTTEELLKGLQTRSATLDLELKATQAKINSGEYDESEGVVFDIEERIDQIPLPDLEVTEINELLDPEEISEEGLESNLSFEEEDKSSESDVSGYPGWKRVTNYDGEFIYYIYRFINANKENDQYYAYNNQELQAVCDEYNISTSTKPATGPKETQKPAKKKKTDCQIKREARAKDSRALRGKAREKVRAKMSKTGEKWMKVLLDGGKLVGYGKPITKVGRGYVKNVTYSHKASTLSGFLENKRSGDCWALSEFLQNLLKKYGYTTRIMDYPTSLSAHHRTIQLWDPKKQRWYNFDYTGLPTAFHPTKRVNSGRVISKIATVTWTVNNAHAKIIGVSNKYTGTVYTRVVRKYPECKG